MMPFSLSLTTLLAIYLCAAWTSIACTKIFTTAQENPSLESMDARNSRSVLHADTDRAAAWARDPPAACATAKQDTIVTWDSTASPPRCNPDVCGGAVLTDLRDVDGRASVGQICAGPLFDTKRTKACLKDKRVLFLGDSSMHEMVMDIISLLEGLAHNDTVFFEFLNEMIKLHRLEASLQQYSLPSGTVITFYGGSGSRGRNFTVTQPSSSEKLHFRFIGHHHLGDNCIGLPTVFHPVVMPELLCEMALIPPDGGDCRPAHILVLNSGQHDKYVLKTLPVRTALPYFTAYLDSFLALLLPHHRAAQDATRNGGNNGTITPYKVVWRGNTRHQHPQEIKLLEQMDDVVRERLAGYGIPFLETTTTAQSTPNFPECCTVSHVHIGSHEFPKYLEDRKVAMRFTASSMVTNEVLRSICPFPSES